MNKFFVNKKYILIFSFVVILIAIGCALWLGLTSSPYKETPPLINPPHISDESRIEKTKRDIVFLQESLVKDPQNPEIQRSLSRAFLLTGDTQKAQQYITQAIIQKSDNPQYHIDLGNIYFVKNEILKAEEEFNRAINLFNQKSDFSQFGIPKDFPEDRLTPEMQEIVNSKKMAVPVVAYTRLADIYLRQNKPQEAIRLLEEGITLSPQYPDFYKIISQAYRQLDDVENESKNQKIFEKLTSFNTRS